MGKATDADLVRMTTTGDHEAYKELVARYQGHVYGLAYSLVSNWTEAQDIAQEAFIRAYVNLDKLRDPQRFAGWLRRVGFGVTMNWLKAFRPGLFKQLDGKFDLDKLEIPDFQPGPPEIVEKRELGDAVMQAIASLPPKYRVPLTMFHLDGLSYKKVADFLDIPLGTVKGLIYRARKKLKSALPSALTKDLIPVVQEVFNEHKLREEFAQEVLQNVAELSYKKTECTFCGSVSAYTEFLGAPARYDFVMGISGSAFKLIWHRSWCPSNNTLLVLGLEPARRTFRALGYQYEFIPKVKSTEEELRSRIVESIRKGRPVLTEGIVGPAELGIIAGFEDKGDVLLGRSFFHDSRDYYRKPDWYEDCHSLLLIGEKTKPLSERDTLREAIEWAIQLAHTHQMDWPGPERVLGLAAYDEWAAALLRDEDFPANDPEALSSKWHVNNAVTLSGLMEARRAASSFLKSMADVGPAVTANLLTAAEAYAEEVHILDEAAKRVRLGHETDEDRLRMADRGLREFLADHILQAKEKDRRAVTHLEQALAEMQ